MRAFINKWSGLAVYLVSVSGMSILCAILAYQVALQAVAISLPYFPNQGSRQLSLVERRQIDASQVARPLSRIVEVPQTVPSISPQILAAQLDTAEKEDLADKLVTPRPVRYSARRRTPAALSAADEFARSFGILTVASR